MGSTGVGWRLAQSVEPLCLIPLNQSYAPLWSRTWLLQQTWKLSVSHIVLIHPRLGPFICQDTWVIRIKQLIKPRSYLGLCRPGLNTSSVLGAVMLVSLRQVAVSCIWYLGTMSALRHLRRIGLRSRATSSIRTIQPFLSNEKAPLGSLLHRFAPYSYVAAGPIAFAAWLGGHTPHCLRPPVRK